MEETPDQILARLQRHADSIRRATKSTVNEGGTTTAAPGSTSRLPPRSLLRAAWPAPPAPFSHPAPAAAPGPLLVHWGAEAPSDLIPAETALAPRFGLVLRTVVGQVLTVLCCVLAVVLSITLKPTATLIVTGVLIAGAAVGAARRVPFAGWCTLGLVIGGVLGRYS